MEDSPWASGPTEVLNHGIGHLASDTDFDRRIAMISIDNAVELMLKTYLGLPKRITGISVCRETLQQAENSFPKLLDLAEETIGEMLVGVDTGQIEWFHRLRNMLYHQGNGLTVERSKCEAYAVTARMILKGLFGIDADPIPGKKVGRFASLLESWGQFQQLAQAVVGKPGASASQLGELHERGIITDEDLDFLRRLRQVRNHLAHGLGSEDELLEPGDLDRLIAIVASAWMRARAYLGESESGTEPDI